MEPAGTISVTIRFYAELNDFLPACLREVTFTRLVEPHRTIKDIVEALGVPHVEIDLIIVDNCSVGLATRLRGGENIGVYPRNQAPLIDRLVHLLGDMSGDLAFICDVHLGKLARSLRMLGFDTLYRNDYTDAQIAQIAQEQHRVVLSRDRGLLKRSTIEQGYWMRANQPLAQCVEIVERFDLAGRFVPFSRCMACNALIRPVEKQEIEARLLLMTRSQHHRFCICPACNRIYWKGSHQHQMQHTIALLAKPCK